MPTLALVLVVVFGAGTVSGQVPAVGDLAPDFTLQALDGSEVSLVDLRGRTVIITFIGYG